MSINTIIQNTINTNIMEDSEMEINEIQQEFMEAQMFNDDIEGLKQGTGLVTENDDGSFSSQLPTLEYDNGEYVDENGVFHSKWYTKEELALLNMEINPSDPKDKLGQKIEQVIYKAALGQGFQEITVWHQERANQSSVDMELRLDNNIELFDRLNAFQELVDSMSSKFELLRARKNIAWSMFINEMESNSLMVDAFDHKLNLRLFQLGKQGKEVTDEQWAKAMAIRSRLLKQADCNRQRCGRCNTCKRFNITKPMYDTAKRMTALYQDFWKSKEGKELSAKKDILSILWAEANSLFPVTFTQYNGLKYMQFNPYWTNGDTEDVDERRVRQYAGEDMGLVEMDDVDELAYSHIAEMRQYEAEESKGKGFWNWRKEKEMLGQLDKQMEEDSFLATIDQMLVA